MELYEHNLKAYESMKAKFQNSNKTAIIHPTGTGKMFIFLKWLIDNPDKTFLFLAPTSAILYQLQYTIESNGYQMNDFPNLKGALYCQLLNWNTEEFKVPYNHIVLDEFHRAGAPKWGQVVNQLLDSNPNSKILGLSATPTRYTDHKNMTDIIFEGNIASEITLAEAMAKGILPLPMYINTIYSLEEQMKELEEKIGNVKSNSKKRTLEELLEKAKSYLSQVTGLSEIFEKYITKKDGKYLVFCKDIKHLEQLKEKVNEWFGNINSEIEIYDIHSKHEDIENEITLRKFRKDDSARLKLLLSVEMLNEGLHVEDIDGVIMLRPTESHIIYLQQLGRGLSIHQGKPLIIDIVNNINAYQNIYDIREEIKEIIRRNPSECIVEEEMETQFQIIDYVQNVMEVLKEIDKKFRLTNIEKLAIIQRYLNQGHPYLEIKQPTKDEAGNPIGKWIADWRAGIIRMTEEERQILTSMGETWQRRKAIELSPLEKVQIIQEYVKEKQEEGEEDPYSKIVISTKDKNGYPIGKWIKRWRNGESVLPEVERIILQSFGETFEKRNRSRLSNEEKIIIIQEHLDQGHPYDSITSLTVDSQNRPIGQWIAGFRKKTELLSKKEYQALVTMGETFESKQRRIPNIEKIKIIQAYLNENHVYSDMVQSMTYRGYPIGKWIADWRYGRVKLTEEERQILMFMGETFEVKKRIRIYNLKENVILQKEDITTSKKR